MTGNQGNYGLQPPNDANKYNPNNDSPYSSANYDAIQNFDWSSAYNNAEYTAYTNYYTNNPQPQIVTYDYSTPYPWKGTYHYGYPDPDDQSKPWWALINQVRQWYGQDGGASLPQNQYQAFHYFSYPGSTYNYGNFPQFLPTVLNIDLTRPQGVSDICQVVMGDAAVRPVRESLSTGTWNSAVTASAGDILGNDWNK